MEFEFQPNLRRMALLAAALSYWNCNDVQVKLRRYLLPYSRRGMKQHLPELINEVVKKIDRELLPDVLYGELALAVKDLGFKMTDWFCFLTKSKTFQDQSRPQIYDKFFRNIYWTHYGTINEIKILRDFWLPNPAIDVMKKYIVACRNCQEDVIRNLWSAVSQSQQQISYRDLCDSTELHLVAYWNALRENDLDRFRNDVIGSSIIWYDVNKSIEVNMLYLSVWKGYVSAFKFFWNKITEEERESNITSFLSNILRICFYKHHTYLSPINNSRFYRKERQIQIFIVLMNFLTENAKRKILETLLDNSSDHKSTRKESINRIFRMILHIWPWQEFLQPVFKEFKDFFVDEIEYGALINSIIRGMYKNYDEFNIPVQQSIAQIQLHQVWLSTPSYLRAAVANGIRWNLLLKSENLASLKLILNDRHVADGKQNLLESNYCNIISFVKEGKDDFFVEILNEIMAFQELNQEHFKSLPNLILKGEFTLADELLNDLSDEEKVKIKSNIDHEIICCYFILKEKFNAADEFLKWKSNDIEEIEEFKASFLVNDFTIFHIKNLWDLWKENVDVAKVKCDEFLVWILGTESTLECKLVILHELVDDDDRWNAEENFFKKDGRFLILEDFVYWCTSNEDMFEQIKETSFNYSRLSTTLLHLIRRNRTDEAERLLNWVFGSNDNERKTFMQRFLLDRYRGIQACINYVDHHSNVRPFGPWPIIQEVTEKFNRFINFFIKPYLGSFDEFKNEFRSWGKNHFGDSSSEGCFSDEDGDDGYIECRDAINHELFLILLDHFEPDIE